MADINRRALDRGRKTAKTPKTPKTWETSDAFAAAVRRVTGGEHA